jgi:hypothetical protein
VTAIEVRALQASEVGRLEQEEPPGRGFARAAEERVGAGGRLAVGVGLDNPRARALYERLGYRGTGEITTTSYSFVDDAGVTRQATETDETLVKHLA